MSWLRLDDAMGEHRKTRRLLRKAGLEPLGLHTLAMLHASRYLTDGFIEDEYVEEILDIARIRGGRRAAVVGALEQSGQWERVEGGWRLHDYLDYNPTRAHVEEQRRKDADRKAAGRNGRSGGSPQDVRADSERTDAGQPAESDRPVPSRPVLTDATHQNAHETPIAEIHRNVTYQGKRVSPETVADAERLLDIFNVTAGRSLGAWTTNGRPSPACKQIIGAMLARPDVTFDQWKNGVKRTIQSPPAWISEPVQIGHVFGEKAAEWALTDQKATRPTGHEATRARRAAALTSLQTGAA